MPTVRSRSALPVTRKPLKAKNIGTRHSLNGRFSKLRLSEAVPAEGSELGSGTPAVIQPVCAIRIRIARPIRTRSKPGPMPRFSSRIPPNVFTCFTRMCAVSAVLNCNCTMVSRPRIRAKTHKVCPAVSRLTSVANGA